jgi:hypothetical protein
MAHPEVEPPSELFFGIGLRLRWTGAVLLNRLDDRTIVLYVARPGHSLPKPR